MRRVLAAAIAAPWVLWALARAAGLDALGHPVVAAMSFTPYAALTSPIPVFAALGLRRWLVAVVALASAVALVAAVAPRWTGAAQAAPADSGELVVMTLNTLGGSADPRAVMRLVRERDVDVLSVQELTPQGLRRLEDAGVGDVLDQRFVDPQPGAAGSGLLSRLPLRPADAGKSVAAAQPEAVVAVPGAHPVRVKAVHPYPPITPGKVDDWREVLRAMPRPRENGIDHVLAGDFNATLDHRELRRLLDRGYVDAADAIGEGLVPTWPSHHRRPPITIDHVLVPRSMRVRRVSVHTVPGTDHRAVIAELRVPR